MLTFHQIYTVQPPQLTGVGECVGRCCREDWGRGRGGKGGGVDTSCPTDDSHQPRQVTLGRGVLSPLSHTHICTHTHTQRPDPLLQLTTAAAGDPFCSLLPFTGCLLCTWLPEWVDSAGDCNPQETFLLHLVEQTNSSGGWEETRGYSCKSLL